MFPSLSSIQAQHEGYHLCTKHPVNGRYSRTCNPASSPMRIIDNRSTSPPRGTSEALTPVQEIHISPSSWQPSPAHPGGAIPSECHPAPQPLGTALCLWVPKVRAQEVAPTVVPLLLKVLFLTAAPSTGHFQPCS